MKKITEYICGLLKKNTKDSLFLFYYKRLFVILFLVFFIISVVIYYGLYNANKRKMEYSMENMLMQIGATVENIFNTIENDNIMIFTDINTEIYLSYPNIHDGNINVNNAMNVIKNNINNMVAAAEYIDTVSVYSFVNEYVLSNKHSGRISDYFEYEWFRTYKETGKTNFVKSYTIKEWNRNIDVISVCTGVYARENEPIGIIVFNINKEKFKDRILSGNDMFKNIIIYNECGESFFALSDEHIVYDDAYAHNGKWKKDVYSTICTIDDNYTVFAQMQLRGAGLGGSFLPIVLILCVGASVFLTFVTTTYISTYLINAIDNIVIAFQMTGKYGEEAGKRKTSLDFLVAKVKENQIITVNYEKQIAEKIAEIQYLQAYALQMQFSPHFLCNSLNVANLIVMNTVKGDSPASRVLILLARLLEIALDYDESIVKLSDELEYAKIYLEIENLKNGNFDVTYDIAPEILGCRLPKLILQPVLENSFEHGIKYLHNKKRGLLHIKAGRENSNIIIEVKDNGAGMSN